MQYKYAIPLSYRLVYYSKYLRIIITVILIKIQQKEIERIVNSLLKGLANINWKPG